MRTEPGLIEEGVGLVDPAAGGEGGEVGGAAAVPGDSGFFDQRVDAKGTEPLGLGRLGQDRQAGGGRRPTERFDRDVGGDVLGTGMVERRAPPLLGPVGAEPSGLPPGGELFDGSGVLLVVWLGRRRIAGIDAGRSIQVQGRIGEHSGVRTIYNPRYELQPRPGE